jgi:hypothetical protein
MNDTAHANDDWMWDGPTRYARRSLTSRIIREHPAVTGAEVTCNQAPLQVRGEFDDGRIFLFHARHGHAGLAIAVPDQSATPHEVGLPCSDTLSVDDDTAAAALFASLLDAHPDHP